MPLYEYQCEKCGESFEAMQKFSDEPFTTHENCGGPVHRLISAPALQFKGSGWYITDYAKSNSGANGSSGKTDSSESKPASGDGKAGSTSEKKSTSTPASTEKK